MGLVVFISYATVDSKKYQIRHLAQSLETYDEIDKVLFWEEDMDDDIFEYMNDNLDKCDVLLLMCSPNASHSEAVRMEWMSALKLKKKVIPVFTNPVDIPPLLTTKLGVMFQEDFKFSCHEIHRLILKKGANSKLQEMSLDEMAKVILKAIFDDEKKVELDGQLYPVQKYSKSGLRYVHTGDYKFIEQNPTKKSKYAKMAQEGKKILWIMKGKDFHARIIEDEFAYV